MRRLALLLKLALRNVFRNRRHTAYALATLAAGATALFVFMGFNRGLMNQYRENTIHARWAHGQVSTLGYQGQAHADPVENWIEHPDRVLMQLRALPGVVDVFPRVSLPAILVARGRAIAGQGQGIDGTAEQGFFTQLNYVDGGEWQSGTAGIVLGRDLAQGLGVGVGDNLQVVVSNAAAGTRSATLPVTGIFHSGSHEFDSQVFRLPLNIAQGLLGSYRVETFAVALAGVEQWPTFAQAVRTAMPGLEAFSFEELDAVYYGHAVDWLDAQFSVVRAILLLMVFLATFNVISSTVLERTAEIGTLRANGDSRAAIIFEHTLEAVVLGVSGVLIGLLGGWFLAAGPLREGISMPPAPGITRSFRVLLELSPQDALQVLSLCVATAVAGCLLPAWRVACMPITKALRHV